MLTSDEQSIMYRKSNTVTPAYQFLVMLSSRNVSPKLRLRLSN